MKRFITVKKPVNWIVIWFLKMFHTSTITLPFSASPPLPRGLTVRGKRERDTKEWEGKWNTMFRGNFTILPYFHLLFRFMAIYSFHIVRRVFIYTKMSKFWNMWSNHLLESRLSTPLQYLKSWHLLIFFSDGYAMHHSKDPPNNALVTTNHPTRIDIAYLPSSHALLMPQIHSLWACVRHHHRHRWFEERSLADK